MTTTDTSPHPYRLRIPPNSPRGNHSFGTVVFSRDAGWYPISEADKRRFERTKLHDMSPNSPPLFQIVTTAEAVDIDRAERASSRRGTARNPADPSTGEAASADEIEALHRQLAAHKAAADTANASAADTAAKLDNLLGALGRAGIDLGDLGVAAPAPPAPAPQRNPPQNPPAKEAKPPKPPKPGSAAAASGKAPEPPTPPKPASETVNGPMGTRGTTDDPLGGRAAIEGVDAQVEAFRKGEPRPGEEPPPSSP